MAVTYLNDVSDWTYTTAFETVVCVLQATKALKENCFFLILTTDDHARLATQLMSPRCPEVVNVVVGYEDLTTGDQGMDTLKKMVKKEVWPSLLDADVLPPLNWSQIVFSVTPIRCFFF